METINTVVGTPMGFLVYFAYKLTNNYGAAILLFALVVKVIVFPVNVLTQKNSIRLLQLNPILNTIKRRYAGDKERINEEQYNIFQREKYSPFTGFVPLFIQLFLLLGMLQVMYHPLQHMLHLNKSVIDALVNAVNEYNGTQGGFADQLLVIEALRHQEYFSMFRTALIDVPDAESILNQTANTNLSFLGFNLGEVPSLVNPSVVLLIPLFAGLSALAYCLVQNAISPGALSQSEKTNIGFTVFTVALSLYFALVMPVGVGIYWTANNILSIVVVYILLLMYPPRKLAGEAVAQIEAERKSPNQLKEERQRNKDLAAWEKRDAARFGAAKKQLVFYAISGGQYKFYKNIIEYILSNSNTVVHYLTNDPEDALFQQRNSRLVPYYAGQKKNISMMLKLDADVMVTTVPDLQCFHIKRSVVRDNIEYIYIPHGPASTHLTMRERAYDHYDTIFCVGPHQVAEIRRREEIAGLPKKNLVKAGYGLYDTLTEACGDLKKESGGKPGILIAPSWQVDNIMDTCINDMLNSLLGKGYTLTIRPHPQYTRAFPERITALKDSYSQYVDSCELVFDLDFSDNKSTFLSDILITDWSGIAFEFSYCTLKPCIFINTPMKVMNPKYKEYGLEVMDISFRDKVGVSVSMEEIHDLNEVVDRLLREKDDYKEIIEQLVQRYLYYPGRNGEAGGRYIISKLDDTGNKK